MSLFVVFCFLPELRATSIFYNDGILHATVVRRMVMVSERGGDIFDFWSRSVAAGHALARSSHMGLYLLVWGLQRLSDGALSVEAAMHLAVVALAALLPWSWYWGSRLLGLSRPQGLFVALMIVATSNARVLGLGLFGYTFTGHGLYNQVFGLLTFPVTVGLAHRAVLGRGGIAPAAASCALTWTCHLFVGYLASVWILLDAAVCAWLMGRQWPGVVRRWLAVNGLFVIIASGVLLPLFQDRLLQSKSPFEPPFRWLGHGLAKTLSLFAAGKLLDAAVPVPVISALAVLGWLACAWRLRRFDPGEAQTCYPHSLGLMAPAWLVLFAGPATFGEFLYLLPFSKHLQWDRCVLALDASLILCAAVGASEIVRVAELVFGQRVRPWAAVFPALLLAPGLHAAYRDVRLHNGGIARESAEAWGADAEFHRIVDFATTHIDARYDPGDHRDYGASMSVSRFRLYGVLTEFGVECISFLYHGMSHSGVLNYFADKDDPAHARLLNIRYVILPPSLPAPPGSREVLRGERAVLYDNGNREGFFMPAVAGPEGCVDEADIFELSQRWFAGLFRAGVFPRVQLSDRCGPAEATLESALESYRPPADGKAPGRVLESETVPGRSSRRHKAKVLMDEPGLLVFKMAYHPQWRILVNGKPAETFMVLPGFTAFSLGRGIFEIEAEYVPSGLRRRLFALGALLAVLALAWRRLEPLVERGYSALLRKMKSVSA